MSLKSWGIESPVRMHEIRVLLIFRPTCGIVDNKGGERLHMAESDDKKRCLDPYPAETGFDYPKNYLLRVPCNFGL
jgi:hypothetical protein